MKCPACGTVNALHRDECVKCGAPIGYLRDNVYALELDVVAVRKGKGQLRVAVHDLYDADKVGTAPGIDVMVT